MVHRAKRAGGSRRRRLDSPLSLAGVRFGSSLACRNTAHTLNTKHMKVNTKHMKVNTKHMKVNKKHMKVNKKHMKVNTKHMKAPCLGEVARWRLDTLTDEPFEYRTR